MEDAEYLELYGALVGAYARWCQAYLKGQNDLDWSDGNELDYLREQIKERQDEMERQGFSLPMEFTELPQETEMWYLRSYEKLICAYAEWCRAFLKGTQTGPRWTDGQALNYLRKRIAYEQNEMAARGFFIPTEFAELPPEMDWTYMRERERIECEARKAFGACLEAEDYLYIIHNMEFLGHIQLAVMKIEPKEALEPVEKLKEAIEKKDFPAMRRYSDVEAALGRMKLCRAEMEDLVEDMQPF